MLIIDGSQGEGGGQVLRTALALSLITQTPFRIEKIRARRAKPGLLRQHLTCVKAAQAISGAQVEGAGLGAKSITFTPGPVRGGAHYFAIGSAGSTTLVAQTIMLPLCFAAEASRIRIEGGTHNMSSPPFPFLKAAFLPLARRMALDIAASLLRPGFYPAGGGEIEITVRPTGTTKHLVLEEPGDVLERRIEAIVANLPFDIAEREATTARRMLNWSEECARPLTENRADGHGNVVLVTVERSQVTEVFTGFGKRDISAEAVATQAAREASQYLGAHVAVGEHLADQLLLPMALAKGGSFTTVAPSQHTRTNIAVIEKFLPVEFELKDLGGGRWRVSVQS